MDQHGIVSIADVSGNIIYANDMFCEVSGYAREELIGQNHRILKSGAHDAKFYEDLWLTISSGHTWKGEVCNRSKSGRLYWVRTTIVPSLDANGLPCEYISIRTEITRIKKIEAELTKSKLELEERVKERTAELQEQVYKRKQQEERARELLVEKETILGNVSVGIAHLKERIIVSCNRRFEEIFQYEPGELIGKSTKPLYESPETFERIGAVAYDVGAVGGDFSQEVRLRHKDGSLFWGRLAGKPLDPTHPHEGSVWVYSDISEQMRAEEQLRIAATAFETQEAMLVTDTDGVILRVNQAFTKTTGYTADEVVGKTPSILHSGRQDEAFYDAMWEAIHRTGYWAGEVWDKRKNGEIYPKWLSITAVKGGNGIITHYVGSHADITERKAAQDKIMNLAFYNTLTELPNRLMFLNRLQNRLDASASSRKRSAVLFIDLDYFKTVNDTLGHSVGNLLLQKVAQRLIACARMGDTLSHPGGDEFMVLLEDLSEDRKEAATQAKTTAEKIRTTLGQPYLLAGHEIHCTGSIGITLFGETEQVADELIKQAEIAMYRSKQAGRNRLHFFDPQMQVAISARSALEDELRKAINGQQFQLYYQAQVNDKDCVTGAEALIRWIHPKRGLVSPLEFIPLLEETGLILPVGQWVLETACAQLARWAADPDMAHLSLAINVAAQQMHQADFVDQVLTVLETTGGNPKKLKLEITESVLIDRVELISDKMSILKLRGVSFAIDDFGTGYSSLSYLKRLPIDQLKIDQSFISGIPNDANDVAIVKMVIALAQSVGLAVMAEGVKMQVQRDFLASCGCRAYQGYLFARPVPIEEFERALKKV
ncbi:EAL domain-containing protein [Polynucleobacter sp.]|uniref:sensor domain-containing protein n=1 Tax=Polynucleobacter sp. TaxID=2029855 RepID=UPI00272A1205|nr:EAL domain-containing protein [Polynucleobacter sp.]